MSTKSIPLDDIFDYYSRADSNKKLASSLLLKTDIFAVSGVSIIDSEFKEGFAMLNSSLEASIGLIRGLVLLGQKEYGNLWLRVLQEQLNQLL